MTELPPLSSFDPFHDDVPDPEFRENRVPEEEVDRVNTSLDILNLEYTIMVVEREYPEDDLGVVSFLRSLIRVLVKRMNDG